MYISNYNKVNIKKVTRIVTLRVPAQAAKLTPPVGPILGQFRLKVKDFCDDFNNQTKNILYGLPLNISLYIYKDKSFDYIIKPPSTMFLIKNFLKKNLKNKNISILELYKISLILNSKCNYYSLKSIFKNILSTLKSMKLFI